ncbi:MAG: hypothetical protein Q8R11_01690 [bacterium]|nr:hypothetical protein [bacterium]
MQRRIALIGLFFLLAFQTFWHFNLLFLVQGNIRLATRMVSEGERLYRDFYLHYPGLVSWVVSVVQRVFPNDLDAFRIVYLVSTLGTTVLLFWFCRWWFKSWGAAVFAATLFSLWIFFWGKNMFWYHTPILLLSTTSFFLLAKIFNSPGPVTASPAFLFSSGFLLGIAFLCKQPAAFFVAAFGLVLLGRKIPFSKKILDGIFFALGVSMPIIFFGLYYYMIGDFWAMWDDVVVQGFNTGRSQGFFEASWLDIPPPRILVQFILYYYLFKFFGLRKNISPRQKNIYWLVLAGGLAGTLFVYPRVWPQYTQFALPFLVIMAVWVMKRSWSAKTAFTFAIVSFMTLAPMLSNFFPLFRQTDPRERTLRPVVAWIQTHTSPDEKIFVCCTAPEVYIDGRRKPASRYSEYNPPMLVSVPLEDRIIADLERTKPRIVVELSDSYWERLNVMYMKKVLDYIHAKYRLIEEVQTGQQIYERR